MRKEDGGNVGGTEKKEVMGRTNRLFALDVTRTA
jgi:hypothetical protein